MHATYRPPLVPNRQIQLGEHVFLRQFHWRKCWKNRHRLQWSCRWAFVHRAEFHAPNSTVPNRHYQSALRLGQHELKYTHAVEIYQQELNQSKNFYTLTAVRERPPCRERRIALTSLKAQKCLVDWIKTSNPVRMRFDSIIAGNPKLNFAKDVEKSFTPHEAATMINGFLEGWIWAKFYEIPVWVATRKDNPLTIVDKLAYCLPSLSKRRRKLLWFLAGHVTTLLHENQLKMRWWCDGDDTFSVSHAKMTLLLGNLILKIRQSLREIFPARFLFFQALKLPFFLRLALSTSVSVNNRNNYCYYPSKFSLLNAKKFISYMIDSIWHLLGLIDIHSVLLEKESCATVNVC